jgi:hypothetical protein
MSGLSEVNTKAGVLTVSAKETSSRPIGEDCPFYMPGLLADGLEEEVTCTPSFLQPALKTFQHA